jgi:hypothetical protein
MDEVKGVGQLTLVKKNETINISNNGGSMLPNLQVG